MGWTTFSSLVGFLIIFRTSQAYARFWEGCTCAQLMRAEWFDSCSVLVAFCKTSNADEKQLTNFRNLVVRLFSMLHAAALAAVEDSRGTEIKDVEAFTFELIDAAGIDFESLCVIRDTD